uniref:RING-H2 finger protein ATL16-like n=1 Tax=Erigeron canadensis TaxID=72917 RepID=UPI001CB99425|nr:RING-H2 finger protein ATL16-like [Erigeron canadensis]
MVLEIVTSVGLLFVGIAVLVIIHLCIAGSTLRVTQETNDSSSGVQKSRTMSEDDIKKLPWYAFMMDQGDNAEEARKVECSVCLESFKGGDKCRLLPNCKHSFHVTCIDSWLIKNAVCPVCRACVDLVTRGGENRFSGDISLETSLR